MINIIEIDLFIFESHTTKNHFYLVLPFCSNKLDVIKFRTLRGSNKTNQILQVALSNLQKFSSWEASWMDSDCEKVDGILQLKRGKKVIKLDADVKNVAQEGQLSRLIQKQKTNNSYIIIAGRISKPLQEKLKSRGINFLDSGGNAFIDSKKLFLLIDGKKSRAAQERKHLFTNASIQLLFHLFIKPELLKGTYRDIANATGASLDNISKTFRILRDHDFIETRSPVGYIFKNQGKLLEKWIPEYGQRLKPQLLIGRFSFLKDVQWGFIQLDYSKTRWSGEPAADKLLGILPPIKFTLYTSESQAELIRNYRLIPDPEGPLMVYKSFWDLQTRPNRITVPELLVYADLVSSGKPRNIEVAKKLLIN